MKRYNAHTKYLWRQFPSGWQFTFEAIWHQFFLKWTYKYEMRPNMKYDCNDFFRLISLFLLRFDPFFKDNQYHLKIKEIRLIYKSPYFIVQHSIKISFITIYIGLIFRRDLTKQKQFFSSLPTISVKIVDFIHPPSAVNSRSIYSSIHIIIHLYD